AAGDDEQTTMPYAYGAQLELNQVMQGLFFSKRIPEGSRRYPNHYLSDLDFSPQLELGNAVVTAKVAVQGGRLWLGALPPLSHDPAATSGKIEPPPIPGVAKVDTYLRVIVTPKKSSTPRPDVDLK
ncbi:MAG: hypothetical protein ACRDD1_02590, partial [Planctomycetia bacterium]